MKTLLTLLFSTSLYAQDIKVDSIELYSNMDEAKTSETLQQAILTNNKHVFGEIIRETNQLIINGKEIDPSRIQIDSNTNLSEIINSNLRMGGEGSTGGGG